MTTRDALSAIATQVASGMKQSIVEAPLPLKLQSWAIYHILPVDPWPKSLAYQQCLANRVIRNYGPATQGGPFKGMTCIRDADEGCLVPKLLGCYEEELVPTFENFFERGFDRFIDVGCASGYWLTGVAIRKPGAQCYGFEADEKARARCAHLLALNGVQRRVKLFGLCLPGDLEGLIERRTLMLMDVDGPEIELLDPQVAPALLEADIIVECHDYLDSRITPTLISRFERSHSIEKISSRLREPDMERYPGLRALPRRHWVEALAERRPTVQDWLVMRVST